MRKASLALLRTQSDDRLVTLARRGDELAFEAIVERYRRPLLRQGRRLLSEASAEDAVQQAFISAWSALRRGDDVRELEPWLHRILRNVALNVLRGAPREAYAQLPDTLSAGAAPEDELERRMAVRRTLADVAALPERQREALLRTAVEGRSQEEVARALGLTHGAVAQLVLRGRRALRAAATAVTPPWLVDWLASLAGTGAVGVGKVAAVVVVAGTAATGPALIDGDRDRPRAIAEAHAAREAPERPRAEHPPLPEAALGQARGPSGSGPSSDSSGGRSGSSGRGSGRSGSSGSGGGSGGSGPGESGSGSGGTGSGSSGSSGSGSSGSGSSGSGSGGSGSGGTDTSGSGGSSGSGSSGSGSGGSGSSGSGSSGSGSSSSGSGSTDTSGSGGSSGSGSSGSGSGGSGSGSADTSGSDGSSGSGSSGSGSSGAAPDSSGSGSGGSGSGGGDTPDSGDDAG